MTSAPRATDPDSTADEPSGPPRLPRVLWAPALVLVTVVVAVIAASSIQIPYYSISPGSAFAVAPLVEVTDGPNHPPEGEIYLTTVSLGRTTIFQAIEGWLDPTVDVVEEKVIVPKDVDRTQLREFNLQLMDTSKERALGVAFEQLGFDAIKGDGAEVAEVQSGTAAHDVLVPGDVIVAIDGKPVEVHNEAVDILGGRRPGDTVRLTVDPAGDAERRDVRVTLGENPDKSGRPLLGVILTTRARFEFPYRVEIASERIGGPSAGLAFTLEVLDVLTEGELTGGRKVAATGTIELDGSVGPVGGVAQKTVAVRRAGVDLFLVPKAELAHARKHAGKGLRVEPVENLEDALRVLAGIGGNGLALLRPGTDGA